MARANRPVRGRGDAAGAGAAVTPVPATRVRVAVELGGVTTPAATAHVSERRGQASTTLAYDPAYTGAAAAYPLSPELPLVQSRHHVTGLPGAFADSAPDRWGRNLIAKRLRTHARLAQQVPPTVREVDYLLGVADQTRQGALRFATPGRGRG